jgi:hypothetical protein
MGCRYTGAVKARALARRRISPLATQTPRTPRPTLPPLPRRVTSCNSRKGVRRKPHPFPKLFVEEIIEDTEIKLGLAFFGREVFSYIFKNTGHVC